MARYPTVRTAARAIIIEEGRLLTIAMQDEKGSFYILPGGGQRPGETLIETLHRECIEELGCAVKVSELLYIREYIGRNHKFSEAHHSFHQVEIVFRAKLDGTCAEKFGKGRDNHQVGIAWLPLDKIADLPFFPEALKGYFKDGDVAVEPVYMGDIN